MKKLKCRSQMTMELPLSEFLVKEINGVKYVRVNDVMRFAREVFSGKDSANLRNCIAAGKYAVTTLNWNETYYIEPIQVMRVTDTCLTEDVSVIIKFV